MTALLSQINATSTESLSLNVELVAPVLRFLAELSRERVVQDWLGLSEGNVFWSVLLGLLCNTPAQVSSLELLPQQRHQVLTMGQRYITLSVV